MSYEELLKKHISAIEAYVRYRVSSPEDGKDILQDVYLKGFRDFASLRNEETFKGWMIAIARNEVNEYFRNRKSEVSIESVNEAVFMSTAGRHGNDLVMQVMESLNEKDRQILQLHYWQGLSIKDISKRLNLTEGTAGRRLFTARDHFRRRYEKETGIMTKMPDVMPEYVITPTDKKPFTVVWEELQGWFLVPREGNKLKFGIYDRPDGRLSESFELSCKGRAEVHGIEGVMVKAVERSGRKKLERQFIAQLTDKHCRYLAESHIEDGVQKYYTFLDGDVFLNNWGYGPDNIGNEIHLQKKGEIVREGNNITSARDSEILDVVGRYDVTINGKTYDTICLMDIGKYDENTISEQYLDHNGKTVLWRRFNKKNWRWLFDRHETVLDEVLQNEETITVNGQQCFHWYDCITDYIL